MTIEQLPHPEVHGGGCGCGEHDVVEPTIDATLSPTVCVTRLSSARPVDERWRILHHSSSPPASSAACADRAAAAEWTFEVIVDGPESWDVRTTRLSL